MLELLFNILLIIVFFIVLGFIFFCLIFQQYEQEKMDNEVKNKVDKPK